MKHRAVAPLTLTILLASFVGACGSSSRSETGKTTIAVIPKGTSHVFWQSIHAGAAKAAQELGVDIIWRGPLREDDRASQISEVEGFITRGVSGIVLAPLDEAALVGPVQDAVRAKIPVVIIDSGLKGGDYVSFVATDNRQGGRLAAEGMAVMLPKGGRIVMLRYAEGSASTTDREEGFLQEMKTKFPNIELISTDQYAGATRDTAKRASENLLQRFGNEVNGVFASNESASTGMLLALQDMGKAGKISFVGFDSTPQFIEALKTGQMQGVVLQSPFAIGELGVKAMIDSLLGKPVEKRIDTGVMMVTPENMNSPEAQKLLNPPV